MTNLLATIFVVVMTTTNDIPRWTPQAYTDGPYGWTMYVDEASPGVPLLCSPAGSYTNFIRLPVTMGPNMSEEERVRVVQSKRVTRLTFEWHGKSREIVDEVVLSETRTVMVRMN